MAERQRIREIEKKEEKLFWLEQKEAERQKQMIIEEERQKLLREHAHKLIGTKHALKKYDQFAQKN